MLFLYNLGVRLYGLAIWLMSGFQSKASAWRKGRQQWRQQLRQFRASVPSNRPILWLHAASLGEFEQGRPIIEAFKTRFPDYLIVLTFFSPSGYSIRKNYELADYVAYLPLDTPANSRDWLDILQPQLVVFVKYEFWYHFLTQLHNRRTPTLLISAVFRPEQIFFRWYGGLFRTILHCFDHIFVQDDRSFQLLHRFGYTKIASAGDTRVDRVQKIAAQAKAFPVIKQFVGEAPVLIAGSTWPEDEAILVDYLNTTAPPNWRFIIAPHEIQQEKIQQLEQQLPVVSCRYSQAQKTGYPTDCRVLIIDNIGMLSSLYRYGRIAYIGGGFGKGIHNTLEPVAFALPVIFGPKYHKFTEAVNLIATGGAFSIEDAKAFRSIMDQLTKEVPYQATATAAQNFIQKNQGATQLIMEHIANSIHKELENS